MGKKLIKTIIDSPENVANAIRLALQKKSTISELIEVESDSSFIGWAGVDSNDTALLNTLESIKVGDVINLVARKQTGNKPLMFTTNSNAENRLGANSYNSDETFYYSYDGIEWTEWETDYDTLSFSKERPLYIKGDNPDGLLYASDADTGESDMHHCQFYFDAAEPVYCSGNIMSLLGEDITDIPCEYCFKGLFMHCTALVTAPELPATTLAEYCYNNMFYDCSSLVTAPELPATTLARGCYSDMFFDCSSLVTAPELPATTLAEYCYNNMFYGCSSLVTAPALPATTLARGCYASMFADCTKLITAPELPATQLAEYCYSDMFSHCTKLITAPELPATQLAQCCYQYMFYGCTALVNAPELKAETLAASCYIYMFQDCSSLQQIVTYQRTAPGTGYSAVWVAGIKTTGTMYAPNGTSWGAVSAGNNTYPSGWTLVKSAPPAA